jgi:hypothetical protein
MCVQSRVAIGKKEGKESFERSMSVVRGSLTGYEIGKNMYQFFPIQIMDSLR